LLINGVNATDNTNTINDNTISDANISIQQTQIEKSNQTITQNKDNQNNYPKNQNITNTNQKNILNSNSSFKTISNGNNTNSNSLNSVNNKNIIYISPTGTSTSTGTLNDPTNWDTAKANINTNGIIYFKEGTYNIKNQVISKNLTLSSYSNAKVTLNADKNGYFFYNMQPNTILTIVGLTFANGTGYQYSNWDHGGAIYSKGIISIFNSTFINNTAMYGGAIFCNNTCYIQGCVFIWNNASNGGAINSVDAHILSSTFLFNSVNYNGGAVFSSNQTFIRNSLFISNNASIAGAVFSQNYINIINSSFITNKALYTGGAVYTNDLANVSQSLFKNNTADSNSGGAIFSSENVNILSSTFADNTAKSNGGAVSANNYCYINNSTFTHNFASLWYGGAVKSSMLNIEYSNFTKNIASYGGALYTTNISCIVNNSNFNSNFANVDGGSVFSSNINSMISNSVFFNNSASHFAGAIYVNNIKSNFTGNIFLNNTALTGKVVYSNSTNLFLNYNWWGNNTPFSGTNKGSLIYNLKTSNYISPNDWIIMVLSINDNSIYTQSKTTLNVTLNTAETLFNIDIPVHSYVNLPMREVKFTASSGLFSPSNVLFKNSTTTTYKSSGVPANIILSATIDNQVLYKTINVTLNPLKTSILSALNLIKNFDDVRNFTGRLCTSEGDPIIGRHVALNLTRLNSWSKVYWVTTDTYGDYFLEINLSPGDYTCLASFDGDNMYMGSDSKLANIKVNPINTPKAVTVLNVDKFNHTVGAGLNFTGKLVMGGSNSPIVGQHISLNLHRIGSWSKVYWVTTDTSGNFQLPINLSVGEFTIQCTYGGSSVFQGSSAGTTISVTSI
jgi:predicted outer membrane repeat protein